MIRVKRNTGFSGMLGKINIYMDGHKVARIKEGQQIELELPTDEAKITVSQFVSRSNELLVKNGQVIEITNSSWLYAYYLFIFIAFFLIPFFLPHNYNSVAYFILLTIATLVLIVKKVFDLKVIYP